jgi:hypothetical protein
MYTYNYTETKKIAKELNLVKVILYYFMFQVESKLQIYQIKYSTYFKYLFICDFYGFINSTS